MHIWCAYIFVFDQQPIHTNVFLRNFPHFVQFKSEFGNKELMIWATVSSRSCFCWLYRASPSLAAKKIINLISVSTIWWCPSVESSLVLLEEGVCCEFSWQNSISLFFCFILYSKAKFACYSRCFLTSYFSIPVPYNESTSFWGVTFRRSCRSS